MLHILVVVKGVCYQYKKIPSNYKLAIICKFAVEFTAKI